MLWKHILVHDALTIWGAEGISRVAWDDGTTMWTLAGKVRWKLGGDCKRVGETALLTAVAEQKGSERTTIVLKRYSFDRRVLESERVVHRYRGFCDMARAGVVEVGDGAAVIASEFIVLD